ncbi:hypothetical protein PAPJP_110 [Pseudomonas phage PAP-JP]|uniref:Uncharacterized protein n=1 Tax=Pseudomonas phage PAP-JP TaxID=2583508 RepID=A0A5C1K6L1_9CAUD|nr:hypothetical protein PAPJP_110 [Pseudomonas phage PAP-JP]
MGSLAGDILLLGWGMVTQLTWLGLCGDPGMQCRYTMGHDMARLLHNRAGGMGRLLRSQPV